MSDTQWAKDAFDWITGHWAFCAFVLGIIFEFPKWKLKPFTAIFTWIGRHINQPVMDEVAKVDSKVDALKEDVGVLKKDFDALAKDVDVNEMDTIRSVVLDFANSCRNGRRHSKEEFDHIISLNDKYTSLLEKYGTKNGVYDVDYAFILKERERCQEENSYLA